LPSDFVGYRILPLEIRLTLAVPVGLMFAAS
jgi:hypothetical protein